MEPTNPATTFGTGDAVYPPVRYGPGTDQAMPHSWAAAMLAMLAEEKPRVFSELIGRVSLNGAGH